MEKLDKMILALSYLLSAVMSGSIATYFFFRLEEIVSDGNSILTIISSIFLLLILFVCVSVLSGWSNKMKSNKVFRALAALIVVISSINIIFIKLGYAPEFKPYELIYVVYEQSLMLVFLGFFGLFIKKETLSGVHKFQISGR